MATNTRIVTGILMFALGLAGCDSARSPSAPSTAAPSNPQPSPSVEVYTLTPSVNSVTPGGELSVSWTASTGGTMDWIGLFSVGARDCDHGWSQYTRGALSGTLTLTAPTQSGQYEFRYHLNNGCVDTVRSSPVTVTTAHE
jgi:hypothetical protein